ncbi:MAG: bifunctional pyr operon transcriptional regulator/uracil phosphoribosyltransferase PyrR [Candidatus Zixiibacteriota bacterium]|nr:MAG: bifunctional pyr operon transcriptional regulator/uracil phosphoribosyltransferase PyrR [candidate division Zixibacteria bacterium]
MSAKSDVILNEKKIDRALTRIAHEILEQNPDAGSLVIIGIITRGAHLADRIAKIVERLENVKVPVGYMDIGLYRDDVHSKLDQPVVERTDILFDVVNRNVILVDDVLFTGRTVRAALDQIVDFGRPRTIQLAVLIDRGHRELPIKADYVGVNIPTAKDDQVVVHIREKDKVDEVLIEQARNPSRASAAAREGARKDNKGGKK